MWLCTLYSVYTPEEERLSAQLAAVEMLKSGTTTFLEAGTIRFTDEVVDGLAEAGIRGRIGRWAWDLPPEPDVYRQSTDDAIAHINDTIDRYPGRSRRPSRGLVDGGGPHHLLGSAVAGCPRGGRPPRGGPQLPHEPGPARPPTASWPSSVNVP